MSSTPAVATHSEKSLRIALIGPGAIGCTVLAHLARIPGTETIVCARSPLERVEVETPSGTLACAPLVLREPAEAAPVDWVLIATKTYDAASASLWLPNLCGPSTRVVVLQNGVEHRSRFSTWVKPEALVPVIIDCPAERVSAGKVRQRGPGKQVVPDDEAGRAYARLFEQTAIATTATADWTTAAWKKLCINSPGALSAILLMPSVISRNDDIAEVMRGMVHEVIAVGRAEGANLEDAIVDQVICSYRSAPPDSMNSMHADRTTGRPMEVDARNGVVVRLGRRHGIPAPLNAMAVALLGASNWTPAK